MDQNELIALFIRGELTEAQQQQFNHLLRTDDNFKEAVEFQSNLKTVIQFEENSAVKSQLQELEQNETTSGFHYKKWFIAASVIVLLGLTGFWYFNRPVPEAQLYSTYFEPYSNVVHPIVRGTTADDIKTKAFIAYEAQNYGEALKAFNLLLSQSEDASISFYKAIALMQLKRPDEAVVLLAGNTDIPETLKAQQQWYLALAYLKVNNKRKAIFTLDQLIKSGNYNTTKAKELIERLKR